MKLKDLKHPLAIAMWDFTWLQRHYEGGSFEDYDKAIDELVERGYNAVRIDCYPHLVAKDKNGNILEKEHWLPSPPYDKLWGNDVEIELDVRHELVTFIHKLQDKGVYIGLSNWMHPSCSGRNSEVEGIDEFVRVWDETLQFLKENDCLKNVVYVDLLNEYPLWHGFKWLTKEIDKRKYRGIHLPGQTYNSAQHKFYRDFAIEAIERLRAKWDFDFMACATENFWGHDESKTDFSSYDVMDVHLWVTHYHKMSGKTGYLKYIHPLKNREKWTDINEKMMNLWNDERDDIIKFLDKKMAAVEKVGNKYHIPYGNTEGWGAVMWDECPELQWDFIKEAGLECAKLAVKHNYSFICTCNFCHPHFTGLWDDIQWHKEITSIIKNADIKAVK